MASATQSAIPVDGDELTRYCAVMLQQAGVPAEEAGIVATNLVAADLRGVESHGAALRQLL